MRKRWAAVALLFAFFAPIVTYSCMGSLVTTWSRTIEPVTAVTRPFRQSDISSLTTILSAACTAEQLCIAANNSALPCSTPCTSFLSDENPSPPVAPSPPSAPLAAKRAAREVSGPAEVANAEAGR